MLREHGGDGGGANGEVYEQLFLLFGVKSVQADVLWYIRRGVLSLTAAEKLERQASELVRSVANRCDDVIEAMGVPTELVHSPIAKDYVKYNEGPNRGELVTSKL